jgi:hypothetical protein
MSDARWRGEATLLDPKREFIRNHMPSGRQGFVVEDLDLILRHFGRNYELDSKGRLSLIEIKVGVGTFGASKAYTLGLLDQMCRSSEMAERYRGFYLVYTETDDWENAQTVSVNGYHLSIADFKQWMNGNLEIEAVKPTDVPVKVRDWKQ